MIARASAFTAEEVARATGGQLFGNPRAVFNGVATDSRDALAGLLYVALVGERFDGHAFVADALRQGARGLLVSAAGYEVQREAIAAARGSEVAVIVVDDTLFGLGELGKAHRRRWSGPVLALTGSNGKTGTKEMIAAILSASHRPLKTEGNLNNLIGVPLTLLGLSSEHDVAVVEMGMNRRGEIARYAEIAEPDAGLVINIGPAHIGELGSIEQIALAKGELYRGIDKTRATMVVNLDDARVVAQAEAAGGLRRRTFGRSPGADVRLLHAEVISAPADEDERQRLHLSVDGQPLEAILPLGGAHNALNAAGAIALATSIPEQITVSLEDVARGLENARNVGRRLAVKRVGSFLVVDDAYNANGASMIAAIETVASRARRTGSRWVALLGEMRELGAFSDAEHAKVGRAAAEAGAALVAAFGPLAKALADEAVAAGARTLHSAEDEEAWWLAVRAELRAGDVVLIKGSRGIRMERFLSRLEAEA